MKRKVVNGFVCGVLFGAALGFAARVLGDGFCNAISPLLVGPVLTAALFCPGEAVLACWPYACPAFYGGVGLLVGCVWWLAAGRRRAHTNHCMGCGYNLTGNVSGICPECGETVGRDDQACCDNDRT